jgi:integrase/recombinase XerD
MLNQAVQSYLAMRRAAGFALKQEQTLLRSFAAFSSTRGESVLLRTELATEWAGQSRSVYERAHRLAMLIRCARHLHAEDPRHEIPHPVFGPEKPPRPTPYILSAQQIADLIRAASLSGCHSMCRQTYSTLFALLACSGLRVSEATGLRFEDIGADGLLIRCSKFHKSRLVPLHPTAREALERYIERRRRYAPSEDHLFVSLRRNPLSISDVENAFRSTAAAVGLPVSPMRPRATPHSLRHTFAVKALQSCPEDRDAVGRHMLALSTYLGHTSVNDTYWYLEAVPELLVDIAERCECFVLGGRP